MVPDASLPSREQRLNEIVAPYSLAAESRQPPDLDDELGALLVDHVRIKNGLLERRTGWSKCPAAFPAGETIVTPETSP